jgi:hypothetical protein
MRRARLTLHVDLLKMLLGLPSGLEITGAKIAHWTDGIELEVEHPDFPENKEGEPLPFALVSNTVHARRVVTQIDVNGTKITSESVGP